MKKFILAVGVVGWVLVGANRAQACTDFSGFWKGSCSENISSNTDEVVLALQQSSCTSLREGTTPHVMGGTTTATWGNTMRSTSLTWNMAETIINAAVNVSTQNSGQSFTAATTGTYQIVNGQLMVSLAGPATIVQGGTTSTITYTLNCVYDKVANVY